MKLIAIGDIHASGFTDDAIIDDYPKRLFFIKQSLEYIINYGKSRNIKTFVVVGDIYNDKTIIYNEAQNMLTDIFKENDDCKFIMFSGNHDLSSTGEHQKSAIAVFSKFPNVKTYLYKAEIDTEINGLVVPYCHNFLDQVKTISSSFDNLPGSTHNPSTMILYAHVGLNEGVLQSGLSKVDKLTVRDISQFPLAILGHYHKPQEINGSNTRVFYVGSLIPKDWNDKNEEKRFLVVDTESLEVESIPLNVPGVSRFYEFIIKEDSTEQERKEIFEKAKKLKDEGHNVRIVNKTKKKASEEETIGDMIVLENTEVDITDRGINITQSKLEQCKKFLEIKQIEDKDAYVKVLQDMNLLDGAKDE